MALTMSKLETIYAMLLNATKDISASLDHRDFYPCGSAHLIVAGNSPIIKFLKKTPMNDKFYIIQSKPGYWLCARLPWKDAFECQSQKYSIRCYEALQKILLEEGITSNVSSYID